MKKKNKVTIVGAGLVGALQSIYMAKAGYDVTIYERRSDMRENRISAGRSINLALSDRGFKSLQNVGLADSIRSIGIPMRGRMMHDLEGNLSFQPYGKANQSIYSVSRGGLNCRLMDEAEKNGVKILFDQTCSSVDLENATAVFGDKTVEADLLIGADGAHSEVRNALQKTNRFNYSQQFIDYGYKELTIYPEQAIAKKMEINALHIWPRGDFMIIALPNQDNSFTCTFFFPFQGEKSFESLSTQEKVKAFFEEYFTDLIPLIPHYLEEYHTNPTSSMVIVSAFPWTYKDKVMLIGDAAHAMVPFYGQGMNCGFEDCTVFNSLLNENGENWEALLNNYEKSRKPDADAITELALRNFVEMRDKVGDPKFLLQKKIETLFSERHPDKWTTTYSMVTFSDMHYRDALLRGDKQEAIMMEIMKVPNIEETWDSTEVEKMILNRL